MGPRFLLFFAAVITTACGQRAPEGEVEVRPAAIRGATQSPLGSMCFVESVSKSPARNLPTFPARSAVSFSGWASVADNESPAPRYVHVVLRPRSGTPRSTYLAMGRTPRPDVAGADPRRRMLGFEGEAKLPGMGTYEVLVSQSDGSWETLCPTGIELDVGPE